MKRKNFKHLLSWKQSFQFRTATLVLLGIVLLCAIVVTAWFAGEGTITRIFAQIQALQENPPIWIEVPMVRSKYLLAPTLVLFLTVFAVMKISPEPRAWSRWMVIGILIILSVRYILWRSLSTLNLTDPLNGVFSLGLFFLEMFMILRTIIELLLMLNTKDRRGEADQKSVDVIRGIYTPSVDILIPTYNEPAFILRRTIIGCQALEYANKKIYLLDDMKRPEMKELALELGCEYLTRSDSRYAKAGNLNHALTKTNGELIAVFDADFVPTTNFLIRTVGFFQNEKVALLQTPQSFYNGDPIGRNLGIENILTSSEEVFYRQIQPMRDAAGSVLCSGTSFVVRRTPLVARGGFVTDSLSEDYFTGIRLSAEGYSLIYLDEKLSAGLAAENSSIYITQNARWGRGTLQGFFIKSNPLTIPGLSLVQRLAHSVGIFYWFTSISRLYFLLIPFVYSFLSLNPLRYTTAELLYFFLPYYLINLITFAWLNKQSASAFLSDIYSIILCIPLSINTIQVMLSPFDTGFKVTPKGRVNHRYTFNWKIALPLIILFIATVVSLWQSLEMFIVKGVGVSLGWIWSVYNLILIGIAILALLDAPKNDVYEWFDLRRVVRLSLGEHSLWGVTTKISEVGAEIALTQKPFANLFVDQTVELEIAEENLQLSAEVVSTGFNNDFPTVKVRFESVSLSQHRCLVEMLFCRPGQWKNKKVPGELSSLFLLLKTLIRPRFLFDRKFDVRAISVSKY
ncbi:glycosyltransferase [Aetokthonos hydrillicola Thurmond2011]|jgi:cellulose synthase (UDP-forming)|uniref:Glycosyltransferase n=1 Tax=Aetokthonos hydrillicola Thurmond2011 TaxID=2712845 RepID=A0AAP5I551_9CYAN|nr:glycosyltransferase [Aetokthonos hydrillicola]MBO3461542.1 glycosyltransferase [Aetokthonos hydrillicola CCALA 1050]MBW4584680.1 glycosyltransferase [Aetokthonos hydrillicola CCALA 1050]MDR9895223.1 glycosyltransferase [Aetokthonos hydrillicola Thurmond2011]